MVKKRMFRHAVVQPLDTSYRLIPLTRGQNAIVDLKDFEWISQRNWFALPAGESFYALTSSQSTYPALTHMHRLILGCKDGEKVDHINGNGLDNRRENLRVCTSAQNSYNRKIHKNNSSGYKGVVFYKIRHKTKPWRAKVAFKGKRVNVGSFSTREEAARAYDKKAKELHGEFAHLNFPLEP